MVSIIFIVRDFQKFCKTSYLQSEQKQNQSAFNQHSFIHSMCNLEFMIFSCSMRAVSLYFKNLRYIYALKSSFDFVDFVSYYWNRGNKSSLDKRERLNGISGLPLLQSLRYLRWNWSTLAWGVVFFATISLNFVTISFRAQTGGLTLRGRHNNNWGN